MYRISTGSTIQALMAPLVLFLMVMFAFGTVASAASSAIAWNVAMPSPRHYDVESMSDLLLARVGSESRTLAKAKQLIQDLSLSTTCSHAPTVRLLQQCKSTKPKHENAQADHQLSNAESVFAISMALCEAHQARVTAPPACKIFQTVLERPLPESSIEIIRSDEIEACSAALYGTPAWTSYSTYKSNSRFLCESSRTDYQREELLHTLREATNVIPEILDVLIDHRTEAQNAINQLRESAASVDSAQREILLHAREQGRTHSEQLKQLAQYFEALQETMAEAVSENSKVLVLSTERANEVDQKLAKLYASFAEVATGLTFDLDQQITLLAQQTTVMLNQIRDLGAQDNLNNLQATMHAMTQTAFELSQIQAAQIATGQEVLQAFHNFSPEHLLPRWLGGFSNATAQAFTLLKVEGPLFVLFVVPTLFLLMLGRLRSSLSVFLVYAFARAVLTLHARVPTDTLVPFLKSEYVMVCISEVKYFSLLAAVFMTLEIFGRHNSVSRMLGCYVSGRTVSKFAQEHKYEMLAILSDRPTQYLGLSFLIAFVVCFCATTAPRDVHSMHDLHAVATETVLEQRPRRAIKEEFERSRRACSVPLDCEYA